MRFRGYPGARFASPSERFCRRLSARIWPPGGAVFQVALLTSPITAKRITAPMTALIISAPMPPMKTNPIRGKSQPAMTARASRQ